MEEMVSNCNYIRSSMLSAKTKLIELDTQLNRLDAISAGKRLAMGLCTTGNAEGGSDSVIGGFPMSLDRSSISAIDTTMNAPFPMPSTITSLSNKRIHENEVPIRKYFPLPVKQSYNKYGDDFHGGCPIIEENHAPYLVVDEDLEVGLARHWFHLLCPVSLF